MKRASRSRGRGGERGGEGEGRSGKKKMKRFNSVGESEWRRESDRNMKCANTRAAYSWAPPCSQSSVLRCNLCPPILFISTDASSLYSTCVCAWKRQRNGHVNPSTLSFAVGLGHRTAGRQDSRTAASFCLVSTVSCYCSFFPFVLHFLFEFGCSIWSTRNKSRSVSCWGSGGGI